MLSGTLLNCSFYQKWQDAVYPIELCLDNDNNAIIALASKDLSNWKTYVRMRHNFSEDIGLNTELYVCLFDQDKKNKMSENIAKWNDKEKSNGLETNIKTFDILIVESFKQNNKFFPTQPFGLVVDKGDTIHHGYLEKSVSW